MNVAEILRKYLENNNFDGLCNSDLECGCELDDLFPCDENAQDCKPGFKIDSEEYDFIITTNCPECGTYQNAHHSAQCKRSKQWIQKI
jgi:hypothetical protein